MFASTATPEQALPLAHFQFQMPSISVVPSSRLFQTSNLPCLALQSTVLVQSIIGYQASASLHLRSFQHKIDPRRAVYRFGRGISFVRIRPYPIHTRSLPRRYYYDPESNHPPSFDISSNALTPFHGVHSSGRGSVCDCWNSCRSGSYQNVPHRQVVHHFG